MEQQFRERLYSDEAYQMASIALHYWDGQPPAIEANINRAVDWTMELLEKCEARIQRALTPGAAQ